MSHMWRWVFAPGWRYITGYIACSCGWATTRIDLHTRLTESKQASLHAMEAAEMIANRHTPHRGWDVWQVAS